MRSVTDKTSKKIDELAARAKNAVTKTGDALQTAAKATSERLRDVAQTTGKRIENVGGRFAPSSPIGAGRLARRGERHA